MNDSAPSTIAASTTCPRPERLCLEHSADHTESHQQTTAAKISDDIERHHGLAARGTYLVQQTGQCDVIEVVTGALRQGSGLAHPVMRV